MAILRNNIEVKNEYGEIVFEGDYEGFLEENEFDLELEEILNKLLFEDENYSRVVFTNDDGEDFYIRRVDTFEDEEN